MFDIFYIEGAPGEEVVHSNFMKGGSIKNLKANHLLKMSVCPFQSILKCLVSKLLKVDHR